MQSTQLGIGMQRVSEYFAAQRAQAVAFWPDASKLLASRLRQDFLNYLDTHGVEEVEEAFIERHMQRVGGRHHSQGRFLDWLEAEIRADEPLTPHCTHEAV